VIFAFAAFFAFASGGLNVCACAHYANACEITMPQSPVVCSHNCETECCGNHKSQHSHHKHGKCHSHRLTVDNTVVSSQKTMPTAPELLLFAQYSTTVHAVQSLQFTHQKSSFSPHSACCSRSLLAAISCFRI
jgi:hypothetical protein